MRIVIIGQGPAGISAIESIRSYDQESEIIVISGENSIPYSATLLPDYLLNEEKEVVLWKGRDFFSKTKVQHVLNDRVTEIFPEDRKVTTELKRELAYDRLLIVAGALVAVPRIRGIDKKGVFTFKTLEDAENILKWLRKEQPKEAIVVGAGFIGIDAAVCLKEKGLNVKVIEVLDRILPAMLDKEMAGYALGKLQERGIEFLLQEKVIGIEGKDRVDEIVLESGRELKCDLLIIATGVKPNLSFIAKKLKTNVGVVVDAYLQTSEENIFAAGDIVEFKDRITGEFTVNAFHPNAVIQGRIAGKNIVNQTEKYPGSENLNIIKIFDTPVVSAGVMQGEVVRRFDENGYRKFYVKDKRIVGLQFVGSTDKAGIYYSLMGKHESLEGKERFIFDERFNYGYMLTLCYKALGSVALVH